MRDLCGVVYVKGFVRVLRARDSMYCKPLPVGNIVGVRELTPCEGPEKGFCFIL